MSMYIVDGDLLTAIGEAIREKGELSRVTQLPLVKKSSNCPGPQIPAETPIGKAEYEFTETFTVNGASSVRVTAYCRLPYYTNDGIEDIPRGALIIDGATYTNSYTSPADVKTITKIVTGESVTIGWWMNPAGETYLTHNQFYYIEVDGLDADGNTMETYIKPLSDGADGLTLAQMAEAIGATVRAPLEEDVSKTLTTNGTHDMNGYRWAEVKVANEAFPTTYKEVVVTSEDNIHFDLSDYIVSDNQYFSICFSWKKGEKGSGETVYQTGYYHHNPMMRDLNNMLFHRAAAETEIVVSEEPYGGVTAWAEIPVGFSPRVAAIFEDGVLSFINADYNTDITVGMNAVLRYVE